MKTFTDSRRLLWIGGVILLFAGIWAAFLVLPASTQPVTGPDIQVPKMKNVPPADAPKLRLDTEDH